MENYTAKLSTGRNEVHIKMGRTQYVLSFEEATKLRISLGYALEPAQEGDKTIKDLADSLDDMARRLQSLSTRKGLAYVNAFAEIVLRIALALHHLLIPGTRSSVEAE
jgi:hypothetical protein